MCNPELSPLHRMVVGGCSVWKMTKTERFCEMIAQNCEFHVAMPWIVCWLFGSDKHDKSERNTKTEITDNFHDWGLMVGGGGGGCCCFPGEELRIEIRCNILGMSLRDIRPPPLSLTRSRAPTKCLYPVQQISGKPITWFNLQVLAQRVRPDSEFKRHVEMKAPYRLMIRSQLNRLRRF